MAAEFEALGVMPEIVRALEHDLAWDLPRDIQAEAVPLILGGGDVMAAAETGSGKTGAFALPLVQVVYETLRELSSDVTVEGHCAHLSPTDRDTGLVLDESGLICQSRAEKQWAGGRANYGVIRGKYYYEGYCRDEGISRFGWSLASGTYNLGTDKKGYGFGGTGKKSFNGQFDSYGVPFGIGDVLGCFIDCDNSSIHYAVNGKEFPPIELQLKQGSAWYPAIVLKNAEVQLNFGATPFKFPPSNGYIGVAQARPEDTTLKSLGALSEGRSPLAIIIEPSRELAQQTHDVIQSFLKYLPPPQIKAALMVGGMDTATNLKELREGVDIITGTLGKIESLRINMKNIRFFVLDEADQMMEPDSFQSIVNLHKSIPKTGKPLQVLMFSATLHSEEIKKLSDQICKFPQLIDLKGKPTVPENVDHAIVMIDPKPEELKTIRTRIKTDGVHQIDRNNPKCTISENIKILKAEYLLRLIEKYQMDQALIFVRTRVDAENLHNFLKSQDTGSMLGTYSSAVLHSGRGEERMANLELFKKGEVRFLIATDVAARGLHIESLPFVINYTLPPKPETYIHRIGRTGRADRIGLAFSLVGAHEEKVWYHTCQSRGEGCRNYKLVEDGGCTIWYNEPHILKDIENLLSQPIPVVSKDLSLESAKNKLYGGKKGGPSDDPIHLYLKHLRPVVENLVLLEESAQHSFLNLQLKYQKKQTNTKK